MRVPAALTGDHRMLRFRSPPDFDTGSLRSAWSGHHTQALAMGFPLLVMDMYEHSYQMDFGAVVPRYFDAFFANVRWDEVNARFERAQGVWATASRKLEVILYTRPQFAGCWLRSRAPRRP